MRVTVKKCHISRQRTGWRDSVGSLFRNCIAATGNAQPPMVDSLNGGIRERNLIFKRV